GLLVASDFLQRHGRVLGKQRAVLLIGAGDFLFPLGHLGPAVLVAGPAARPVAQARVERRGAEGEEDGSHEQHEPPARQRVVVLRDAGVAVAGGFFDIIGALALAGGEQQPGQRGDGAEAEDGDVPTPESGHSLLLREASSSRFLASDSSSANGRLAASSKLFLRLLL